MLAGRVDILTYKKFRTLCIVKISSKKLVKVVQDNSFSDRYTLHVVFLHSKSQLLRGKMYTFKKFIVNCWRENRS